MPFNRLDSDAATAPIPVILKRPRWRDTFSSLRIHNYRLYVIAQSIANTSSWMQRIAIDWLVFELTGSVTAVGVTAALQFGPMLLFGPLGGLVTDRHQKRPLLVTTQSIAVVLCGVLAALTITGAVHVWHVYAVACLLGFVDVVDQPAKKVFVNEMVGQARLSNAISVNASIWHLGGLIGPAISGFLIVVVGAGWAIGVNSFAGCIVILALLAMRKSELLVSLVVQHARGQIREALRYVCSKPAIFWPMVMLAFVYTFGMNLPVLLVAFADSVFRSGAAGYGLYSSAAAVGALVGAIASARRISFRLRYIIFSAGLFGVALILTGLAPALSAFLVVLGSIGFMRMLFATTAEAVVQMSSNRVIRGRVMALYTMIAVGGQALGSPLMGWIAEVAGARTAMVVSGAIPLIAAVVIAVLLARAGHLSLRVRVRRHAWPISIVPRGQLG
ncbi:MAG: MFS transporter [Terrimesophilobacter sp.]